MFLLIALVAKRPEIGNAVAPVGTHLDPQLQVDVHAQQLLDISACFRADGLEHCAALANDDAL